MAPPSAARWAGVLLCGLRALQEPGVGRGGRHPGGASAGQLRVPGRWRLAALGAAGERQSLAGGGGAQAGGCSEAFERVSGSACWYVEVLERRRGC